MKQTFFKYNTDKIVAAICLSAALIMSGLLISIFLFIFHESSPLFYSLGINSIITNATWQPLHHPPSFGILSMIISTFFSALGAMLIAAPLGISCAIFLSEFAPSYLSVIIRTVLNIFTGIPSVVYGFLGAATLVKYFEVSFTLASGESLFCASLVLAIMVIPYITTGSYTALKAIPNEYRESVLAMGISKQYLALKVLLPMSYKYMLSSITLAFGRAIGETMAVLMLAGNTLTMPHSWFDKGEPLSALIALELGSAEVGSSHYRAIFAAGLILLLFTSSINFLMYIYTNRLRNKHRGVYNAKN